MKPVKASLHGAGSPLHILRQSRKMLHVPKARFISKNHSCPIKYRGLDKKENPHYLFLCDKTKG